VARVSREIANSAADERSKDRANEWQRDRDDGADCRGDSGSLGNWIFEHRYAP
jgi:hypothetical protein